MISVQYLRLTGVAYVLLASYIDAYNVASYVVQVKLATLSELEYL